MRHAFVTSDPRSAGLTAAVGDSVVFVDTVKGEAVQLLKYGTGSTAWATLSSVPAGPVTTSDPRTAGRAGAVGDKAVYVTAGAAVALVKYGAGSTAWVPAPSLSSASSSSSSGLSLDDALAADVLL